jgi:hypothetical protein
VASCTRVRLSRVFPSNAASDASTVEPSLVSVYRTYRPPGRALGQAVDDWVTYSKSSSGRCESPAIEARLSRSLGLDTVNKVSVPLHVLP